MKYIVLFFLKIKIKNNFYIFHLDLKIGDDVTKLTATWYLDGQVSYNFDQYNTRLTVGVDNLLDEDPPFFSDSFANDFNPSYRTWGSQQWYVRASSKF